MIARTAFALVPAWVWLAGAAAIAAGAYAWHASAADEARIKHEAVGAARVQTLWKAADAQAAAVAASAAAANLRTERERQAAARKEIDDAHAALTAARADSDRAARAASGLRRAFDDRVHAATSSCRTAGHPAPAASSAPTQDRVLSEVFSQLDDFATAVAAEADERGIAGAACERLYDSLQP
jgi:hypothetical protein